MDVVEIGQVSDAEAAELLDGEQAPWGAVGEALEWQPKDRRLGIRDEDGRLVATAGTVLAEVSVTGAAPFQVVGLGGLFVTKRARGTGLLERLAGPLIELAQGLGPEFAMLFCRPELLARYRALDFTEIEGPVWVQQPQGPIEMPMPSMWRALHGGGVWPAGRVEVHGLPF